MKKDTVLGIVFILWMFITLILMLSVVGWVMLIKLNNTPYHIYGEQSRTIWVQFGYDLKDYFVNKE